MTVFELIGHLSSCNPEDEVRIVVEGASLGPTPSIGISPRGIRSGFDWDVGKCLITADIPLIRHIA